MLSRVAGRVWIGTSGWAYKNWHGPFYPAGVTRKQELAYIAQRLPSVEINGTFYSLTRPEHCDAWRAQVPKDFTFAVKGSRFITHMLKLGNVEAAMANFFASGILRLGRQLGPLLWQLPAMVHFDEQRASRFLANLPVKMADAEAWAQKHDARTEGRAAVVAPDGRRLRLRHALEVRHESWLSSSALELLSSHDVALVTADTAGRFPFSLVRTASFAYVRLHGSSELYSSGYTPDEIAQWAAQIRTWQQGGADVYVYFDNDAKVHAPTDAIALKQAVDELAATGAPVRTNGRKTRKQEARR